MNRIIQLAYENGVSHIIYLSFMFAGIIAELIGVLILSKKYQVNIYKVLIIYGIGIPFLFIVMKLQFWIESGFKSYGGYNIVRTFIFYPPTILILSKLLKEDGIKICDIAGPTSILLQGLAHWGCAFDGCCYGIKMTNGIYNPVFQDYRFPIQFVEAIVAIAISVILFIRAKNKNYNSDGTQYPWMLILYGSTRFLLEFLRDNDKLFLNISSLAIHALIMFIIGLVWLLVIKTNKKDKKLFVIKKGVDEIE